ncbi:MAG TPA: YitT family protein [Ignavibacteriales bacterium]|nr:YitT family protein [Ignavibacteriales bacterium]HOL81002.1 YitT family protein [Ignavibacteriales bacterium]HOM64738.1 YitT family protein [Ignavibacteriales bacterium]HPD66730.1 YitT family protein [Ignavibacteriales bacterium]HPP32782.1 YitT family protein [Ignavibacteriales bacterium]
MVTKEKLFDIVRSYVIVTIGLIITAAGIAIFLVPAKIIGGGLSGISTILYYSLNIPIGISYFIMDMILLIISIRILSVHFAIKTFYISTVMSFFLGLFQYLVKEPIVQDNFLATVIGASLMGAGVGLCIHEGGSTGGTDVIGLIISKYKNIKTATIFLYIDAIIIALSYFVIRDVEKLVYGYVALAIGTYALDLVLEGFQQSYQLFIFSNHPEEICNAISEEIGRGITILYGKGWYTQQDKEIIVTVIRRVELHDTIKIVKRIDPNAFISINHTVGVFGEGFAKIK